MIYSWLAELLSLQLLEMMIFLPTYSTGVLSKSIRLSPENLIEVNVYTYGFKDNLPNFQRSQLQYLKNSRNNTEITFQYGYNEKEDKQQQALMTMQRNWSHYTPQPRMYYGAITMKKFGSSSESSIQSYHMTQQFHAYVHT